jgi:1,4-dihydroxy-2-naphthoate octaprenyltransferase
MSQFKDWIKAARLRTLPLSVSGIIVGASLGSETPVWKSAIFWLAIGTTIGFQVLSNFANDYGDGIKGTDDNRQGEKRLVASGSISAASMKKAMIITTLVTLVVALYLIYLSFGLEDLLLSGIFILLGIASIAAAIKYTVGKKAYGYSGFGDVFVFLFFGLLSVLGTYFLFTKTLSWNLLLPASTIGLLSMAVLNLNNMRDIENDMLNHKNTLVVKLGSSKAKFYHYLLLSVAMASAWYYTYINFYSGRQLLYCIAFIPLLLNMWRVYRNKEPRLLDAELKIVALSTFLFAILFGFLH